MSFLRAFFVLLFCLVAFICGSLAMQTRIFPSNFVIRLERAIIGRDLTANLNKDTLTKIYGSRERTRNFFIGDSHIQFGDWANLLGRTDISAEGIAGENSGELLVRIKTRPPAQSKVFISTGTNDVGVFPLAVSILNIREIVRSLSANNKVYLIAPPLTSLAKRNVDLSQIISEEGKLCEDLECVVVDANTIIAPNGDRLPDTTVDGIHLTDKGYKYLSGLIKPLIASE